MRVVCPPLESRCFVVRLGIFRPMLPSGPLVIVLFQSYYIFFKSLYAHVRRSHSENPIVLSDTFSGCDERHMTRRRGVQPLRFRTMYTVIYKTFLLLLYLLRITYTRRYLSIVHFLRRTYAAQRKPDIHIRAKDLPPAPGGVHLTRHENYKSYSLSLYHSDHDILIRTVLSTRVGIILRNQFSVPGL